MKLLVTGTDGYIGFILLSLLRKRGHEVCSIDTGFYRDGCLYTDRNVGDVPSPTRQDLRRIDQIGLTGFDAVIHLAELSNDPLGQHNPQVTYDINHKASVRLARLARDAGAKRFIYTSSCSVYGAGSDEVMTEASAVDPQTTYAECKVLVERDIAVLANDDFSPTFLRNATAYGASPRMRFDIVLNNLAGLAWCEKNIRMNGDGSAWRPLVHVRDICDAIACTLEAPRHQVHNQIFNVGQDSDNHRVKDVAHIVAEVFPGCRVSFGLAGADNRSYRVSFAKIRDKLNFTCKRNAQSGAEELYRIFKRVRMTPETFEFRAFTRLKQLKYLLELGHVDEQLYWREA